MPAPATPAGNSISSNLSAVMVEGSTTRISNEPEVLSFIHLILIFFAARLGAFQLNVSSSATGAAVPPEADQLPLTVLVNSTSSPTPTTVRLSADPSGAENAVVLVITGGAAFASSGPGPFCILAGADDNLPTPLKKYLLPWGSGLKKPLPAPLPLPKNPAFLSAGAATIFDAGDFILLTYKKNRKIWLNLFSYLFYSISGQSISQ